MKNKFSLTDSGSWQRTWRISPRRWKALRPRHRNRMFPLRNLAAEETPAKVYTYEEVRAILAEKSRTGYRAEVKALLTAHGVKQLSDVKSPEEFAAIVAEAEVIGNG